MQPMLATSADALPTGPGWAYEFKWDGVRALLEIRAGAVSLTSRAGNDITAGYPELGRLGAGIDDALVDGEIAAFAGGRPSFGLLQTRMHVRDATQVARLARDTPVTFIAFDLLRLFGVELTGRPYTERRATLDRLAADHPGWTVSPVFDDGPATEAAAREHGLEGVVAKRTAGHYRPGARSSDWLKVKFVQSEEFVVVGWEADAQRPDALSSLLLGYHTEAGAVRLAGKVGSGLTVRSADALHGMLVTRPEPVLAEPPAPSPGRVVTWVEPLVVVEVSYTEWSPDGRLRQPVYLGVRDDKRPDEVVRRG